MNPYALLLIAAMLLVGGNVGVGKSIVAFVPVTLIATLRYVVAMTVLGPLLRPAKMRRITQTDWLNLFLQAFFGTFLFSLLILNGIRHTSAVAAGVITSTIPATVAVFAWIFLRERPSPRTVISVVLAVAGIVLVNVTQEGDRSHVSTHATFVGNLMVLGAVCCESLYVILSRRITQTVAPIEVCAYTHLFGLILMLPLGAGTLSRFDYGSVPAHVWLSVIWYGIVASVFAFWLWMKGIKHVSGDLAGVFTAMVPVAAALYGTLFLGERFTVMHGFALALVVSGVLIACLKPRNHPQ